MLALQMYEKLLCMQGIFKKNYIFAKKHRVVVIEK